MPCEMDLKWTLAMVRVLYGMRTGLVWGSFVSYFPLFTSLTRIYRFINYGKKDLILFAYDESGSVPHLWWAPPASGQWNLNVDGCLDIQSQCTSSGGILRDALGTWICGYSSREAAGTIFEAELLAVWRGLLLAWDKGCSSLICESDCAEVVRLILLPTLPESVPCRDILVEIRTLLKRRWDVQVKFIFREANCVADALAKLGRSSAI
ncbi:Ribonuclease H-like superfamily [Sesbania bispinosa]|nr:Ribonuclease H-like superfamily [Sesbania bispinosa]